MSGARHELAAAAVIELALDTNPDTNPDTDRRAAELAASLCLSSNDDFLRAVVGRDLEIHDRSVASLLVEPVDLPADLDPEEVDGEPTWSLLLRAVHLAFAAHLPLSLSPDVLWYAIVHEIAVHVRLNAEHYATLFTTAPDRKQTIELRDDSLLSADRDWARSIRLVHDPIRAAVGADLVDLLQPAFSTTSVESSWPADVGGGVSGDVIASGSVLCCQERICGAFRQLVSLYETVSCR